MILHPFDLAIIGVYVLAMVVLGMWAGGRGQTLRGYFLADRQMAWPIVMLSIVATETSTVTFLSIPGIAFAKGGDLAFAQLAVGYILGRLIVCVLFVPRYFRGELYTSYQMLQQRFGGRVKEAASLLFLITRSLADGLRLFLTALVLQIVLAGLMKGNSFWVFAVAVGAIGVFTIAYTFVGGIRAVFWMDAIQFFVYMIGAVVALALLIDRLPGGLMQYVTVGEHLGKFRLLDFATGLPIREFLAKPYTFWAGLFGGALLSTATHGTDQLMVQRYLAARSQRDAQRAVLCSGVVVLGQFLVFLLIGVGLAVFYKQFPPPSEFSRGDEVFAHFLIEQMPVGLRGLVLAGVFSAAMSTLSSSLNSSSAAFVADFYKPLLRPGAGDRHYLRVGRWMTAVFGLIQMGVAFVGLGLNEGTVNAVLAIAGFSTGIVLGVFFLGRFTQRTGPNAALVGLVAGALVMTYVWGWKVTSWPWFALIGSSVTFAVGWAAGFVIPDSDP